MQTISEHYQEYFDWLLSLKAGDNVVIFDIEDGYQVEKVSHVSNENIEVLIWSSAGKRVYESYHKTGERAGYAKNCSGRVIEKFDKERLEKIKLKDWRKAVIERIRSLEWEEVSTEDLDAINRVINKMKQGEGNVG